MPLFLCYNKDMKKVILSIEEKKKIRVYSLSGIIVVGFAFLLLNINGLLDVLKGLIDVLSPFIWGIFFAFIMSKFANFLENKLSDKMSFKTKRFLSSLLSVLLLILIIALIVIIITPQLAESVTSLSKVIVSFTASPTSWLKQFNGSTDTSKQLLELLYDYSNTLVSSIWTFLKTSVPSIVSATISTVSDVLDFVIGFIVALYMLIDRERIIESFRRLFKAFLSKEKYVKMTVVYNVAIAKFYKFFEGKLLDSLIIGVICFVLMLILRLDYAMLISVVVGITNIIPFFGPFIGAIPSALILLMVDPVQALVFVIMILVLQQIDGNIIGPKILGDSVGLSSLWIMFAILVGGAYFGFAGMILGVPIFSVIYYLVKAEVDKRMSTIVEISETKKKRSK